MKVINNTDHTINISDIGINLPAKKYGPFDIRNNLFVRSNQLGALIKSGEVSFIWQDSNDVSLFLYKDKPAYVVKGHNVWEGNGKTKTFIKGNYTKEVSLHQFNKARVGKSEKRPNRYVVSRKCDMNVSLEKISRILTKQFPSVEISEEYFNSKEIQAGLAAGRICLSKTILGDPESKEIPAKELAGDEITIKEDSIAEYKDISCIWEGPFIDAGGYANMNRQYVMNLSNLGVSVKPVIHNTGLDVESQLSQKLYKLSSTQVKPKCPRVFATNAPGKNNGLVISYTMMETELTIHKDLARQIGTANEVWVPCDWNKETFINAGIKCPINIMPLGVDPESYQPRDPSIFFSFPVKSFVFYAVSTWIWRKGWDVLLKAYNKAFTSDDDVSLVIFSHVPGKPNCDYDSHISNYVNSIFPNTDRSKFPNLSIITSVLPSFVVPLMYNSMDCFVLFSRGEGWGLPYCEAAASGLPIIGADHGGQKMFLNNDNSLLVEPNLVSSCHPSLLYMSPFYKGMRFANYSEKNIADAADKMRFAYENREVMKQKAELCRNNLLNNFTWDKCARRVAERLKELQ